MDMMFSLVRINKNKLCLFVYALLSAWENYCGGPYVSASF
jgi:hypothetical protein